MGRVAAGREIGGSVDTVAALVPPHERRGSTPEKHLGPLPRLSTRSLGIKLRPVIAHAGTVARVVSEVETVAVMSPCPGIAARWGVCARSTRAAGD